MEGTGKEQRVTGWNVTVDIGEEERRRRVARSWTGYLTSVALPNKRGSCFAVRTSSWPSFRILTTKGLKALQVDDEGNVDIDILENALLENTDLGHTVLLEAAPVCRELGCSYQCLDKQHCSIAVYKVFEQLKATL